MGFPIKITLALLLLTALALGQSAIPVGTALPVELVSALNSEKSKPGSTITARVMKEIPLASGSKIRKGSQLTGKVVRVMPAKDGQRAEITFRFDELTFSHRNVPVTTSLRALASMLEVEDAQVPKTGADRGTPWAWATRVLIGGGVAYGEDGPVTRGNEIGERFQALGLVAPVQANHNSVCEGDAVEGRPRALWVFSSDACGVYGYSDVRIVEAGRHKPEGDIILTSLKGKLDIKRGSGLLLRVNHDSQ